MDSRRPKTQVPEIVWRGNEECVKGYLRALFQADGTVNTMKASCSVRLASSQPSLLKDVQVLLSNFGVQSRVSNAARPESGCCPTAREVRRRTHAKRITN